MVNDSTYKAQFCRQYFVQLKQFVNSFNISNDGLGMKFLLDAYDYNDKFSEIEKDKWKNNCKWHNTFKTGFGDKELMLSIEEYFSITSVNPCQHYQRELFEGLMDSDKFLSNDRVTTLFTDQNTLYAILSHFGIPFPKGNAIIETQIKEFDAFADIIAFGTTPLSFNFFKNALHLYQQCRNRNCHNIIIQEVPQRKIAFQFLAFMYISLTFLLRMGWSAKEDELKAKGYKKPDDFQIPEQDLTIDVKVKDSSDDKIVRYEFIPNYKNGAVRFSQDVEPTEKLRISHPVRKYDRFKLVITYRNFNTEEIKVFGDKGDKMLTYYYWRPTFEVILPEISNLQPGLSNSPSTEKLLAKLLDKGNNQPTDNDNELSDNVKNLIAKLDPLFQKIEELSGGSDMQHAERDNLIAEVNRQILELIEQNKQKEKSKRKNVWGIVAGFSFVIILLLTNLYFNTNGFASLFQSNDPIALIEKGDEWLKKGEIEKAGESYRDAIKVYEKILAKDSNNVDANIGLAMLLMRGKGEYDPIRAKKYAKNASKDMSSSGRRGEGLYAYLLTMNDDTETAKDFIKKKKSSDKDDYLRLAQIKLKIYGQYGTDLKDLEIKALFDSLQTMDIPEAAMEMAFIWMNGIKKDNNDDIYIITPMPIYGAAVLNTIANDSLLPLAMAKLSDFFFLIQNEQSINYGLTAIACGVKDYSPILRMHILQDYDIEKFDEETYNYFEKITRITGQQDGIDTEFSDFMQEFCNYNSKEKDVSEDELLKDLNSIIALVEKEFKKNNNCNKMINSNTLDILKRMQVSLYLKSGNIRQATKIAMQINDFNDSIAVSDYLLAICYDKGWGDYPIDSMYRDSLINSSAEYGFCEAIYTRLRKNRPMKEFIEANVKPGTSQLLYYTPSSSMNEYIDDMEEGLVLVPVGADGKSEKIKNGIHRYMVSTDADVADSIWKKSPKLAMELADYWFPYYYHNDIVSPYLDYCPKDFQAMYNAVSIAYEHQQQKDGRYSYIIKEQPRAILDDLVIQLQIGLAEAINNRKIKMAHHLVTLLVEIGKRLGVEEELLTLYQDLTTAEYKEGKTFVPYMKSSGYLYAY